MPTPTAHYQFIAIARTAIPRRGADRGSESDLRGIEVLEGMEWRKRPGDARTMRSMRRTLSDGTGPATAAAADAGLSSTMWNESMHRHRDAAPKANPTVWSDE
jgi:hypothetical protein